MKKIERLSGIIYAIKENNKITATKLATIFEVSKRTIYRDIDALCQLKVPIIAYEGREGGYEIDQKFFIPSLHLKENEILHLLFCLYAGDVIKVPNMQSSFTSLSYKLLNILDEDMKNRYKKILDRVSLNINLITPGSYCDEFFSKMVKSFLEYKNLEIEYYTPLKDEYTTRTITPYRLSFYNGGWYLDSYCNLRKEVRCFRLDRIKNVNITNESYTQDKVEKYLESIKNSKKEYTVKLEIEKNFFEVIKNDYLFFDADIKMINNTAKITVDTNNLNDYIFLAIENSDKVKIIEPRECLDKMSKLCKDAIKKYDF
ncbi:YafY family protein [Clostridiaceae bacterium M8S5]|nr:YafY family protein [Clostridiaceae bacterium M8S5]